MTVAKLEALSASVEWKLVENLFKQRIILLLGGLTPTSVAALGFFRTGQPGYAWWGVLAFLCLAGRITVNEAFQHRRAQPEPDVWRRRFLVGTWMNGALCGIGGAGSVLGSDAFTQMLVITMLTAFVMGSAARNSSYPKAATGSILLAEVPLLLACLASRNLYYELYTPFIVLFTVSALSLSRHLYAQSVHFLVTDEEKALLVGEVTRSNRDLGVANDRFASANEQLAQANQKLAAIAATDSLTGVSNRRSFDDAFDVETRAARRDGSDLSLLMFDIDSFKEYNDRYGHQAGDKCLHGIAQVLASGLRRPRELLARYGGEEFVAILPQTNLAGAMVVAEALRRAIEALELEHVTATTGIVTVSIGAATLSTANASGADLLRRADEALYVAKRSGRNCVRAAADEQPVVSTLRS